MNTPKSEVESRTVHPWYREPWPWLLMLAPGIAIIWGLSTLWVAIHYADPLVTEHAWEEGIRLQQRGQVPAAPSGKQ